MPATSWGCVIEELSGDKARGMRVRMDGSIVNDSTAKLMGRAVQPLRIFLFWSLNNSCVKLMDKRGFDCAFVSIGCMKRSLLAAKTRR